MNVQFIAKFCLKIPFFFVNFFFYVQGREGVASVGGPETGACHPTQHIPDPQGGPAGFRVHISCGELWQCGTICRQVPGSNQHVRPVQTPEEEVRVEARCPPEFV